jgi:DNA-binding MarR family transcriptional regulator
VGLPARDVDCVARAGDDPLALPVDRQRARLDAGGHPELRYAHGNVLQYLDDDGTRVSDLATRAGMTKQSMARLVEHLERLPDPADGRAKLVRATAGGGEVFAVVREFVAETEARLQARLGAAKLQRLRELLTELDAAL